MDDRQHVAREDLKHAAAAVGTLGSQSWRIRQDGWQRIDARQHVAREGLKHAAAAAGTLGSQSWRTRQDGWQRVDAPQACHLPGAPNLTQNLALACRHT
eukprot:364339-Chlamydomonas_euryale.AAC.4